MFDNYREIFNQRGRQYHQAMEQQPLARREEFSNVVERGDIRAGHRVCDVPSGGGYLDAFIAASDVEITSVDTSEEFARAGSKSAIVCEDLSSLPLDSAAFDRVVSVAGLHHVDNRTAFYREVARILKPAGVLCAADVQAGSAVDRFLNGFVDAHNPMGHRGDFFSDAEAGMIEKASLEVIGDECVQYPWYFETSREMVAFCRGLFGIDLASDTEIADGIESTVGYHVDDSGCRMNWELRFITAVKS